MKHMTNPISKQFDQSVFYVLITHQSNMRNFYLRQIFGGLRLTLFIVQHRFKNNVEVALNH